LQLPEDVRNAEQKLLNRANFIFALSENEKDVIISNYGIQKNKIVLAANGIKDTFYKIPELNPVPDQRLEILFIGRSCKQKGIDVLLNAYELFLTKNGNSFLCLAGGNYSEFDVDREVDEKIDKAPIAGKAIHLGRITHDIVVDLMSKCFVYVQPSRYESQGIAILEAMASGRVVVASDLPAVSEYIKNGVNGILINSGDHTQLANVLQDISQSPNKFLEMSKKARETAKQFTWERMLNIILELY
jgi:glycosyltransferase involved in cell wall biosynthesis